MKGKVAAGAGLVAVLALAAPLIMRWEGVSYPAYVDPVGVATACYGHTGPDVKLGETYSQEQCEAWLDEDMREANSYVRKCIPVPMLPQIEAALTSLVFNVGPRGVCGSTIQKRAMANNWPGACAGLDAWRMAGGRVYRGLVLRRADERKLCETGR